MLTCLRLMIGLVRAPLALTCLLAALAPAVLATPLSDRPVVRFGVVSFDDEQESAYRWQPTVDYLNQTLPEFHFVLVAADIPGIDELVDQGMLDFVLSNGVHFQRLHQTFGAERMLNLDPRWGRAEQATGSALVALASQPNISRLSQLRDLRVVATTPDAFGGFQVVRGDLLKQRLDPLTDFSSLRFVGLPQSTLFEYLRRGEADVAILPTCALEQAVQKQQIQAAHFKLLLPKANVHFPCASSTKLYSSLVLSRQLAVREPLARAVSQQLLALSPQEDAARLGGYSGWTIAVNDRNVARLAERLFGLKPLPLWQRVWRQYGVELLLAVGLLLLLLGHYLRVNYLVAARTRALHERNGQLRTALNEQQITAQLLASSQEEFYQVQRALLSKELTAGMAHELNQPLMAATNYLAAVKMKLDKPDQTPDKLKEGIDLAMAQVDFAKQVIVRLRRFLSRPEQAARTVTSRELMAQTVALFSNELAQRRLSVTQTGALDVAFHGDEVLLKQVLVNVVRNALDALAHEGKPSLGFHVTHVGEQLCWQLSDNGSGFDKAQLAQLFVPFQSSKSQGMGLGMAIVKRIIEAHGGSVRAYNHPSQSGAVIEMILSCAASDTPALAPNELTHEQESA
ncbi:MAG: sensor histidine kinase [Aeromonas sp.]